MERNSETFIIISLEKRTVLIGGTEYAGEMKKSIFSIMNYLLPEERNSIRCIVQQTLGRKAMLHYSSVFWNR